MKQTYLESGLGQIMFQAYYCKDEEIPEKTAELEKIISYIIQFTIHFSACQHIDEKYIRIK